MQSLGCSAQGHSKCEVSEFQTIEKENNFLLKTQPPLLEIPNEQTKQTNCNMGVILQHLVQFYQCFATNELKLLLYNC